MKTTVEVAAAFRCSPQKIRQEAKRLGVGVDLGGSAGFRFTDADVKALSDGMRPAPPVERRRRRRAA